MVYDLKTPGREDHVANRTAIDCLTGSDFAKEQSPNDEVNSRSDQDHVLAERVIQLLGGVGNIVGATNCATRLRVEVADPSIVADNASFVAVGAKGLIITGKTAQVIIGISVPRVKEHFDQIMGLEPEFVPTTSASPPPAQPISAAIFASSISTERSPGKTPGSPKTFLKTSGTSPLSQRGGFAGNPRFRCKRQHGLYLHRTHPQLHPPQTS